MFWLRNKKTNFPVHTFILRPVIIDCINRRDMPFLKFTELNAACTAIIEKEHVHVQSNLVNSKSSELAVLFGITGSSSN